MIRKIIIRTGAAERTGYKSLITEYRVLSTVYSLLLTLLQGRLQRPALAVVKSVVKEEDFFRSDAQG